MRKEVYGQLLVLPLLSHCNPFTQSFVHKFYNMALQRHFEKQKDFGSYNDHKPVITHAFLNQKYKQASYYFEMSLPCTMKKISKISKVLSSASSQLDLKTNVSRPCFICARKIYSSEQYEYLCKSFV